MRAKTAVPVTLVLVTLLIAHTAPAQARRAADAAAKKPAQQQDWPTLIKKANTHRRVMLRRAISRKVAQAGDAAVPAIRAFQKERGKNAISQDFVDAYTRTRIKTPATLALLEDWARDRDFFWRGQALGALADRRLPQHRGLFQEKVTDVAFLSRINAGRGLCLLGNSEDRPKVLALLKDEDPRVRVRVAVALVEAGDHRGLPTLVEALRQDGKFLGDPWGTRGSRAAFAVLKKAAGKDYGYDATEGPEFAANKKAILAFEAFAKKKLGGQWQAPIPAAIDKTKYVGGFAVRSCRNGDLFLRWNAQGEMAFGLESRKRVALPADTWKALHARLPKGGDAIYGKVICDYLRLMCQNPAIHWKSAPGKLPENLTTWLTDLAEVLKERQQGDQARAITQRLTQFRKSSSDNK